MEGTNIIIVVTAIIPDDHFTIERSVFIRVFDDILTCVFVLRLQEVIVNFVRRHGERFTVTSSC